MRTLIQDLKYGARVLLQSPGFSIVALLALMLGIGANSAIFSVVNTILLRPLPYANPEQLVVINHNYPKLDLKASVSVPGYIHYRDTAQSFSSIAAIDGWRVNLTGDGEPEQLQGSAVTPNLFATLGVGTAQGRLFTDDEAQVGHNRVVILSNAFWQKRFGGDKSIVGRNITLNGEGYTVVGVMPPTFQFGREFGQIMDIWSPLAFTPEQLDPSNFHNEHLFVVGRLKPGVLPKQGQAELDSIAANIRHQYMHDEDPSLWGLTLDPMTELVVGDIRPALLILLGAVAVVLLIACANVANLMLARGAGRQKEIAIRTALGANRIRLVRQLLTESVLLSLGGGALGLLLAMWGVDLLLKFNGDRIPRAYDISLDKNVLFFTLAVSLVTGIVFGLVPAFQGSKVDLNETLKEGGRSGSGVLKAHLRSSLVAAEVAMAIILLVGAGLLIRSFVRLQQVNPGFNPSNLLVMQLSMPDYKYKETEKKNLFFDQLTAQLRALPGVTNAAAISVLPMSGMNESGSFAIQGKPVGDNEIAPHGDRWAATSGYFETMNIPLVRGRYFDPHDDKSAPGVAIIDETMAKKYWPNEDPIGQHIVFEGSRDKPMWREVVGIVGHVKHKGLEGESRVQYYIPYNQQSRSGMFVVVRTVGQPGAISSSVRNIISGLDPDLPVFRVSTMDKMVADSMMERRFSMLLLGMFSVLALTLAVVGIYGVVSYMVVQRTNEIGIRMALGARLSDVLKMVIAQGMAPVLIGVIVGTAGALAATRLMTGLLYGVTATDPLTFVVVPVVLALVAFLACLIPARKAAMVNPMKALRCE